MKRRARRMVDKEGKGRWNNRIYHRTYCTAVLYRTVHTTMPCCGRPLLAGFSRSALLFFLNLYHLPLFQRSLLFILRSLSIVFGGLRWSGDWKTSPDTFWILGTTTSYLRLLIFLFASFNLLTLFNDGVTQTLTSPWFASFRLSTSESDCARI